MVLFRDCVWKVRIKRGHLLNPFPLILSIHLVYKEDNNMYFRCQLMFELNRMLELYKDDSKFKILKRAVENLENGRNSLLYFELLNALNNVYSFFLYDVCKDFQPTEKENVVKEICQQYLNYIQKYSIALGDINAEFMKEYRADFQKQLLEHWEKTLYGYDENEKSFLQVFDEMHSGSIAKYPELFTIRLGKLKNLYRTQSGKHFGNYKRLIPDPQFTKNNRWNPEGVAFQYLAYGEQVVPFDNTINMLEKTCFEEFGLTSGSDATVCRFKPAKKDALLINFCFQDLTFDDLEIENQKVINQMSRQKVDQILNKRKYTTELMALGRDDDKLKERIMEIIQEVSMPQVHQRIVEETEKYVGKLMMKSIDEAVFRPVDKQNDPDSKVYIPFHFLAKYLQGKGYSGVIYRSTKMDSIGLHGKNVVLFNPSNVEPIIDSMKVYHFDGNCYHILRN